MERKKCDNCGKYLISFKGQYLHVEEPCNGILDQIDIEATIRDEFLQDKFIKLYGKPELSDYELLNKIYDNKILRFLIKRLIK